MKIVSLILMILFSSCSKIKSLSPEEFEKVINEQKVQILDVRTPSEYEEGHIEGSMLIDVKSDNFKEVALEKLSKDTPVAVYCRSGKRSLTACDILIKEGYSVYNLESGILGWQNAGKKIVK